MKTHQWHQQYFNGIPSPNPSRVIPDVSPVLGHDVVVTGRNWHLDHVFQGGQGIQVPDTKKDIASTASQNFICEFINNKQLQMARFVQFYCLS